MPVHDLWNPALLSIKSLESSSGDDNEANRFSRAVGKFEQIFNNGMIHVLLRIKGYKDEKAEIGIKTHEEPRIPFVLS